MYVPAAVPVSNATAAVLEIELLWNIAKPGRYTGGDPAPADTAARERVTVMSLAGRESRVTCNALAALDAAYTFVVNSDTETDLQQGVVTVVCIACICVTVISAPA